MAIRNYFDVQREIKTWLDRACTIIPVRKYRSKWRDAAKGEQGDKIVDALLGVNNNTNTP